MCGLVKDLKHCEVKEISGIGIDILLITPNRVSPGSFSYLGILSLPLYPVVQLKPSSLNETWQITDVSLHKLSIIYPCLDFMNEDISDWAQPWILDIYLIATSWKNLTSFYIIPNAIPAISSYVQPFQPFPAISSSFQPYTAIPAIYCHFQLLRAISSHFQPFPSSSNHFPPFQPIPAYSSLFQPFFVVAYSRLFQATPGFPSLFKTIPAFSSIF